jgi:hypothetical protein
VLLPSLLLLELPLPLLLPFPLPLPLLLGVGVGGEGPSEEAVVVTKVGVVDDAAVEGALRPRARSRTWRSIPRLSSCPARSPQV